jgi:hypothetical protein
MKVFIPHPESGFLPIPDPGFQIPDPKTAIKGRGDKKIGWFNFNVPTNFTKLYII